MQAHSLYDLHNMYMLECDASGEGTNATYGGSEFIFNTTCPESLEPVYPLSITKIGVGSLQPIIVPAAALVLLVSTVYLYRVDLDEIDESSKNSHLEFWSLIFELRVWLSQS